jgi:hypothetical protein
MVEGKVKLVGKLNGNRNWMEKAEKILNFSVVEEDAVLVRRKE